MTPIQQLYLGVGASKKTYLDDVFSTFLYKGTSTATARNNGIDLAGEGGMVWIKRRDGTTGHRLTDTVRGVTKALESDNAEAEGSETGGLQAFNSNGFTVGSDADYNATNDKYSSWSFRRAKGFFDVVSWTGNASTTQTISHSLGSLPGCIMAKCSSDASTNWAVYHRSLDGGNQPATKYLRLNTANPEIDDDNKFADTEPTATNFTAGNELNVSGKTYVAYVFAGGESTAATARSVKFDGTNDYMTIPTHADLAMGTGDFTLEGWVKVNEIDVVKFIYDGRDNQSLTRMAIWVDDTNKIRAYFNNTSRDSTTVVRKGQWYHFAVTRSGTTSRLFVNGIQELSWSDSVDYAAPASNSYIGGIPGGSYTVDGSVSNFRIVKGTAVYTSSFRPPTEPLTNVTNTKLLCCNNSSVTGSTVSPTTIANSGSTASTDSPFDDPAAFVFGESGSESVIKTGSYVGSGGTQDINIGFEPQWLIMKTTTSSTSENWFIFDSMRGQSTGLSDPAFYANTTGAEGDVNRIDLTPTGFKMTDGAADLNGNNRHFIYIAIRRPDGYVGKPADAGTDVFAIDTGNSSSTIPSYDSGFPVDFGIHRKTAAAQSWYTSARLMQGEYLVTDTNAAEVGVSVFPFDSNAGWASGSNYNTDYQSWMWKRHAGFDVVTYKGDGVAGRQIPHSLGKAPEMVWVKNRDNASSWVAWHKGLNGGTNSYNYHILLDTSGTEVDDGSAGTQKYHSATPPTSTMVSVGGSSWTNGNDQKHIMMLFASVDGISKCGQYTPASGSTSTTVTCGFSPRLVIVKCVDASGGWHLADTTRGISSSGNDPVLMLDENIAQDNYGARNWLEVSSTGFTVKSVSGGSPDANRGGDQYIYYAHA